MVKDGPGCSGLMVTFSSARDVVRAEGTTTQYASAFRISAKTVPIKDMSLWQKCNHSKRIPQKHPPF